LGLPKSTERNANAAQRTVDDIVANINKGKVDPKIEAAAIAAGIIQGKKPAGAARRWLIEARQAPPAGGAPPSGGAIITGPKGQAHDTTQVAQHIGAGGYIPLKVKGALIQSNHYLVPGQDPNNPTAPPKGAQGAQGGNGGKKGGKKGGKRDLSMDGLYERDLAAMYERDLYDQGLYERDLYDQGLYERDLFERDPEAMVTYEDIQGLAKAVGRNPKAGKAVYKALTMDPNVEQVTEKLVADWLTDADLEKREAEAYESYLQARKAEAEAEAEAEPAFYESYLEARDADPEAYADAEAYESYLEARDADPEAEAEPEDLYMIDY